MATADYPIVASSPSTRPDPLLQRLDDVGARRRAPRSPSTTGTRTARSRPRCARCHSSEGFVDYIGGDGSARGRRRQARADEVGDPLRHLPQPGRRRAVVGDVSLGRDRRRPGRRGALHDLPPGALVGPRRRRRDRRRGARHRRHRQRRRSTSRTSTSSRPPPRCTPGARRAATSTRARSTTSASATSTATTPASAATTRTRRRSSSTPAPAATPASPTSAARTRSG